MASKSIINNTKECYVCQTQSFLHRHHIFYGRTGDRDKSEKYGLWIWLCMNHHEGTNGVHGKNGHDLSVQFKQIGQMYFEKEHTRDEFMNIFGKNYLD